MNYRLERAVWHAELPQSLKMTLLALVFFARPGERGMYPGVRRLAWMIGKNARHVTADLTTLVGRGILVPLTARTGRRSTVYELNLDNLPPRVPLEVSEPGHQHQGSDPANPDPSVGVEASPTLTKVTGNPDAGVAATLTLATRNPDASVTPFIERRSTDVRTKSRTAAAPRFSDQAKAPTDDGNYRVICKVVRELLETGTYEDDAQTSDLVEATKCRCAALGIDYGRHPDVDLRVVYGAIVSERFKRWQRTQPAPPARAVRRKPHS